MESAAASAFVKSVMGWLFQVLEKEYNKQKGLAQETHSIQQDLRMVAAAMDDRLHAMGVAQRTAVARLYSEEMLDLVHEVEDCIDRFLHRLTCKQRSSFVHRVAHELKKVQSRSGFADEIHKLKRRLKEAHERVISIPFAAIGGGGGQATAAGSTATWSRLVRNPVGIGKPTEELLSLLDEVEGEAEQLRVISVVGFGGSGKTTLARAVFDGARAMEKFDFCAWVAAAGHSPENNDDGVRGTLQDILRQVSGKDAMDVDGQHHPEASLMEYLKDKRYLIVIDDIGMHHWSTLNPVFKNNGRSSRILLTTTCQLVANMCNNGNGYVYQMSPLSEEDSKKIALHGLQSPELEQGSESLLQKCDGLPLALVSVSDYLKSSKEPTGELCAKLCRNLGSHLEEKPDHDNFTELTKVLMQNYDSLSGYALTCLLYLGIFPNSRPLKTKVLIRRWLAEGYARSDTMESEQDIADENFSKLINRSIIKPVDTRNNAQVKKCRAHGIMHEFILHKSMSQRFIETSSHDHSRFSASFTAARHLSIHGGDLKDGGASDEDLSRVRSLTVFGKAGDAVSYIRKCKHLKVLDLEECDDLEDDHLKHIEKLWQLKYLSLGGTITKLPRSIKGLHCLETLDARRTKINALPIEALELPHLTHLFGKFILDFDDLKTVEKMSKVQKFLCKRSKLRTISGFVTKESHAFLQLMRHMKNLTKVKIWCEPAANGTNYINDLSHAIEEFTKVPMDRASTHSLSLDSECFENLLSSLNLKTCFEGFKYSLKSLKLRSKLLQLPPFVTLLSGLTELCISSTTMTQVFMSSMINLSSLLYLKLIADHIEDFQIKKGALPSLRCLCFVVQSLTIAVPTIKQVALPTITIEQGALPRLVSLQLLCWGLVDFSGIEIRHLKHLKEVTIEAGEHDQQTGQDWERAVKNHPNRPRLLFHKTVDPMESEGPGQETYVDRDKRKRSASQSSLDSSLKKMRLSEPFSSSLVQLTLQTMQKQQDNCYLFQEGYMSASPAAPASTSMMAATPGQMDTAIPTNLPHETTLN